MYDNSPFVTLLPLLMSANRLARAAASPSLFPVSVGGWTAGGGGGGGGPAPPGGGGGGAPDTTGP